MDIRTELKELMENKGFTVLFVATAIGIAKSTVSMWLNGIGLFKENVSVQMMRSFQL